MYRILISFLLILGVDIPSEDVLFGTVFYILMIMMSLSGMSQMKEDGYFDDEQDDDYV
jgi:hypothetical protein